MNKQEKLLLYGFVLFSAISSFVFVFYAVSINLSGTGSQWLKIFAYVAGGYGLMNIYILSLAWSTRAAWTIKANMLIGACFFGVFAMDSIREGFKDGAAGFGGVSGLAYVLWLNWLTVKKLCQRDST